MEILSPSTLLFLLHHFPVDALFWPCFPRPNLDGDRGLGFDEFGFCRGLDPAWLVPPTILRLWTGRGHRDALGRAGAEMILLNFQFEFWQMFSWTSSQFLYLLAISSPARLVLCGGMGRLESAYHCRPHQRLFIGGLGLTLQYQHCRHQPDWIHSSSRLVFDLNFSSGLSLWSLKHGGTIWKQRHIWW